jgi:membrane protease YdiL (CAAX protease family)
MMRSGEVLAWAVLMEGGLGLLACLIGWLLGRPPWQTLHWNVAALAAAVLGAAMPLSLMVSLDACGWEFWKRFSRQVAEVTDALLGQSGWPTIALVSLLAGAGEELFFRGLLQAELSSVLGTSGGLIIASAAFGLMHPLSKTYIVVAGLMGLYLGLLWLALGNLLVPVVTHAVYDMAVLLYLRNFKKLNGHSAIDGPP